MSFVGLNPTVPKGYVLKNLKVFDQRGFRSKKLIVFKDYIYITEIYMTPLFTKVFIISLIILPSLGRKAVKQLQEVFGAVLLPIYKESNSVRYRHCKKITNYNNIFFADYLYRVHRDTLYLLKESLPCNMLIHQW